MCKGSQDRVLSFLVSEPKRHAEEASFCLYRKLVESKQKQLFARKNLIKMSMTEVSEKKLTEAQKARIERNRAKALSLRQAKLVSHPYALARK